MATQIRADQIDNDFNHSAATTVTVGANTIFAFGTVGNLTSGAGTDAEFNSAGDTAVVNKKYVDAVAQGFGPKRSVAAASTANVTGTYTDTDATTGGVGDTIAAGGTSLSIDGVTLVNGDRVLLKDQSTAQTNGVYDVSGVGSSVVLTRSTDFDNSPSGEITAGDYVLAEDGTANGGKRFAVITTVTDIDSSTGDTIDFTAISNPSDLTAGEGLVENSGAFDVDFSDFTTAITSAVEGDDLVSLYDDGATANVKMTVANFLTDITEDGISYNAATAAIFLDIVGLTNATIAAADELVFTDADDSGNNKAVTFSSFESTLTLDNLAGTLSVSKGGTGATTFTANGILLGNGTSAITASTPVANSVITRGATTLSEQAMTTNGSVLIGGVSGPTVATLGAGAGISITNGDGTITIASTVAAQTVTEDDGVGNATVNTFDYTGNGTANESATQLADTVSVLHLFLNGQRLQASSFTAGTDGSSNLRITLDAQYGNFQSDDNVAIVTE